MFDFEFFQNDILIHKYNGLSYEEETFVTDDITYNHNDQKIYKDNKDYFFEIDFKNDNLYIKLLEDNYEGNIKLVKSSIIEKDNVIEIIYQVDTEEPINKIIIIRRKP